jgi:hydrogenase nickel incorporation protein HypA/HybF
MHELSVAQSILDTALARAAAVGATRIESIRLTVGALTAFIDESVRFYWDSITEGTAAEGSTIDFTHIEGRLRCLCCDTEYTTHEPDTACPVCGSLWTLALAGNECYLDSIDVQEEEPVCP